MAINSQFYRGRPGCAHCGFCIGFGCEVMTKSSSLYTMIPEAEATGRCEIRPESYVFRVETDAKGRAAGVVYFDGRKREHLQKARAVVLCANGAETARLLLNSSSAGFPHGLANSKYWFLSSITSGPASSPQTFRKDPADTAKLPRGPTLPCMPAWWAVAATTTTMGRICFFVMVPVSSRRGGASRP